jgi:hypothetical protein
MSKIEFNQETLGELALYLERALSPDPNQRRPG